MQIRTLAIAAALSAAAAAHAAPVSPTYTTFGNLAGATFGGSGIPTNPAAITVANGITLGLIATQRFQNAAPTHDGAGTYFVKPGANNGLQTPAQALGTTWNWGFYVNTGTAQLGSYQVDLFYDLDPTADADLATMGRIDLDLAAPTLTLLQGSQNSLFGYLQTGNAVTTPGAFTAFDPNATGRYTFALRVSDRATGDVLALSAMNVQVPEPASLALVGLALAGAAAVTRRRRA